VAEGVLPPAIQEFVANAEEWIAGIDEMIAADDRLIESIEKVKAASEEAGLAADAGAGEAAAGADAGAAGAASAEAAEAAAAAQAETAASTEAAGDAAKEAAPAVAGLGDELDAEATAAKLAADANRLFAETDALMADAAATSTEALGVEAKALATNREATAALSDENEASGAKMAALGGKAKLMGLALVVGAAEAVHMAANFQTMMTRLVTSAGEAPDKLAMISRGILDMSGATDTSTTQLAQGMYYVESAGFHGARGLEVLRAAAEGAQAEGADMVTVSDALTTALKDYHEPASDAVSMTNQMVTAVSRGKTTLELFASSLSTVLPKAHAVGLSFAQVGGAMATMTAQGMTARNSAQDLSHVISSLSGPNNVQIQEMQQLGINSIQLSKNMGKQGLTGTLNTLTEAILKNEGPGATVLLKSFNQSKLAAQSAKTMIESMPPSIQKLAQSYLNGSISASAWRKQVTEGNLPAKMANLLTQFAGVANKANGFNASLKSGNGNVQTYLQTLSKLTGGMTGTQVALMLGGKNAITFSQNVNAVAASAKHAGANVNNWALIQKNFNFQLGSAEKSGKATAIAFGSALLPAVTAVVRVLAGFAQMLAKNAVAAKAFAIVVGVILAVALERGIAKGVLGAKDALGKFQSDLKGAVSAAKSVWSKLSSIFRTTTEATEAQTTAQEAQTASEEAAAGATEENVAATEAQATATEAATVATEAETVAAGELDVALDANPIGIIIIAIIALVVAIMELWKHSTGFRNFIKGMWRDIKAWAVDAWHVIDGALHGIEHAFDAVIKWVKGNWWILAAILMGPIAGAVAYIIEHWSAVKHAFDDAWSFIKRISSDAWHFLLNNVFKPIGDLIMDDIHFWERLGADIGHAWDVIIGWCKTAYDFVKNIFEDIISAGEDLRRRIIDQFHEWVQEAEEELERLWSDVQHFASEIVSTIENLGSRLFSAGAHIIEMLAHGIMSAIGAVTSAIGNIGSEIMSHLPFSPAKKGPLSGQGDPVLRGQEIVRRLAQGMAAEGALPAQALDQALARLRSGNGQLALTGALTATGAAGAAGAGAQGNPQLNVKVDLSNAMSSPAWQQGLQKAIQQAVLDYAVRNSGAGLILPQRGRVS
jgi:TP901 family phage tail tape measure protein